MNRLFPRFHFPLALGALLLASPACENFDLLPEDRLNFVEARVAAEGVAMLTEAAIDAAVEEALASQDAFVASESAFSDEFALSVQCSSGGTLTASGVIEGTRDPAAGNLAATFEGQHLPQACRFSAESYTIMLDASDPVAFDGTVHAADGAVWARTIRQQGTISFEIGDRAGTCDVDLTSEASAQDGTRRVHGSFCGHSIDQTGSWAP
jgi:hypothetical protein